MTFSKLATGSTLALGYYISGGRRYRRYMPRREKIQGMIYHHIVGGISSLQRELLKSSRTLSVNYGIAGDGTIHGCISEKYKANTSSHYADHSHVTVEMANETLAPEYRIGDRTLDAAARLGADVAKRYGWVPSRSTIRFHYQFFSTACPGPYLRKREDEFIALVRRYYDGKVAPSPAPVPSKPKPKPNPNVKRGAELLDGVGVGDYLKLSRWWGYNHPDLDDSHKAQLLNGTFKITGITYRYQGGDPVLHLDGRIWVSHKAVAGVVARPAAPKRASVAQVAREVLEGKWGNGARRKARLSAAGYSYSAVQAEVNKLLGGGAKAGKSISQMATEVLRGEHGNGHAARQRSLGVNSATYAKVRAEVNRRI